MLFPLKRQITVVGGGDGREFYPGNEDLLILCSRCRQGLRIHWSYAKCFDRVQDFVSSAVPPLLLQKEKSYEIVITFTLIYINGPCIIVK